MGTIYVVYLKNGGKKMKVYKRTTEHGDYNTITIVQEDGTYTSVNVWNDGFKNMSYKTTVQEMGWKSVKEFLSHKKNFVSGQ